MFVCYIFTGSMCIIQKVHTSCTQRGIMKDVWGALFCSAGHIRSTAGLIVQGQDCSLTTAHISIEVFGQSVTFILGQGFIAADFLYCSLPSCMLPKTFND